MRINFSRSLKIATRIAAIAALSPSLAYSADRFLFFKLRPSHLISDKKTDCRFSDPIIDVPGTRYYIDGNGSIADPRLVLKNDIETSVIKLFARQLNKLSDEVVNHKSQGAAQCVYRMVAQWASAKGLTGTLSSQGYIERNFSLLSIVMSLMKVEASDLNNDRAQLVDDWFNGIIVNQVVPEVRLAKSQGRWGNLDDWYTLLIMVVAVERNDRMLFAEAVELAKFGLDQISEDGLIKSELRRRSRAMEYHYFAATALVFNAELATENGVDLYLYRKGILTKLIDRLVEVSKSMSMSVITGYDQNVPGKPESPSGLAWAVPISLRYPRLVPPTWLKATLNEPRLGGDVFALFKDRRISR